MAYYLVDYENVKVHGLDGVEKLGEKDVVCIFYSDNADTMTFALHKKLTEAKAVIKYQKVEVGTKNALDFQLSSYLGYLISEKMPDNEKYYIVTNDNGFNVLVKYWKRKRVDIEIVVDCTVIREEENRRMLSDIENLIKDKQNAPIIVKFIQQCETKQDINNALNKHFKDSKKTSEVYKAIKLFIADKKGK